MKLQFDVLQYVLCLAGLLPVLCAGASCVGLELWIRRRAAKEAGQQKRRRDPMSRFPSYVLPAEKVPEAGATPADMYPWAGDSRLYEQKYVEGTAKHDAAAAVGRRVAAAARPQSASPYGREGRLTQHRAFSPQLAQSTEGGSFEPRPIPRPVRHVKLYPSASSAPPNALG